jgi:hypothetical protein
MYLKRKTYSVISLKTGIRYKIPFNKFVNYLKFMCNESIWFTKEKHFFYLLLSFSFNKTINQTVFFLFYFFLKALSN